MQGKQWKFIRGKPILVNIYFQGKSGEKWKKSKEILLNIKNHWENNLLLFLDLIVKTKTNLFQKQLEEHSKNKPNNNPLSVWKVSHLLWVINAVQYRMLKSTFKICILKVLVTDRSSVLQFCPNQTEQVNQSSVSRTETEQNRTCKKRIKS